MTAHNRSLTGDPREAPAYPLSEAAHYVRLAPATLRSWVAGRNYPVRTGKGFFEPLIRAADAEGSVLSFNNLIEAHVLRALRSDHSVSIRSVRDALNYSEKEFGIERLLLRKELTTTAGELFLVRYGQLVNLSRSGQLAMQKLLEAYLSRVEWEKSFPVRLYPFLTTELVEQRPIAIDPRIAFGRPILVAKSISTAVIARRIDAGESVDDVASDYDLSRQDVEEAVVYERAA
ncbi:MAG: DUF433 domain-containing protein [Gemmatimonadaceae bacterium]